mmetsp:Transcript_27847/g.109200  ORF Transcript_27847/g.109200 Transcript_27847/m.109200 type:complete len:108 (-) Transcript_27847:1766-2089(-)
MRDEGCTAVVDPKRKSVLLSLQDPEEIPTDQKSGGGESSKARRRRKRAGKAGTKSADVVQTLCADETGKPATQLEEPLSLQIEFLSLVKVLVRSAGALQLEALLLLR